MPIKPKPFVYVCPSCRWRKVVSQRSDALFAGEYYECCPTCGNTSLKKEEINSFDKLGIKFLGKLFK